MTVALGSRTLARALELLDDRVHVVVRSDSESPWIEFDVIIRGLDIRHFGIWKRTDVLYAGEIINGPGIGRHGAPIAMGEDPVDVETLAELVADEERR